MNLLTHLNLDNVRFLRPTDAVHYLTKVASHRDLILCVCPDLWPDATLVTEEAYAALCEALQDGALLGYPIEPAVAAAHYSTVYTAAEVILLAAVCPALKKQG